MNNRTELERLLAEWHEHGDPAAAEQFIAAHPEHADALRKHLGVLDLVEHAFSPRPALPESLGPFRIERELGSGGMGCVYRAVVAEPVRGIATGRTVALKVVHPHLFRTQGFFKRFLREAELGQRIDHPNVVRTLDADAVEVNDRPQHYLVMEYVEGQTLRDLVEDVDRVPEELARHIGCEVAKALSAIHAAGAVHRDLKPENVLITEDHEIKVMDLGVARLADEQVRLSQTGAFVGSLHYAAPEQFGGGADVDHRSDLHGLGLLLYEIATGTNPFADEDARVVMRRILSDAPRKVGELNTQLSPFFEELIAQLLAKDPSERFESATDLLDTLEQSEQSAWWQSRAKELRATTRRPLRRIRIPRETAVYGRDAELAQLSAFYDHANAGNGQALLIEGEAGIGKTRLVDEFVSRLQQDGEDVNFLFASNPPGGAATASGAFVAAYVEQLGEHGLEESLTEHLPRTPALVPGLAALLRGDAAPRGAHPMTKDALQACFVQLTRGLSTERTTIVLIDDLHFAPDEGRALFTSVALAVPEHRVLLIGTMRPGVPETWTAEVTRLAHASHLTVPRLGPKDLVQLLGDTLKSRRLAEELSGKIAVKSDGNPFFAFEIVRGLREGQFIRQRADGSWETTRMIEDIEVPSSVLDLVNARVAELDEDERNLLDVAACWGYEFDPTLVAAAAALPRVPALRLLAQIEKKHRLVRSIGRRSVFDHHQVQEALYSALPELLREEYHRALGRALEESSGAKELQPGELGGETSVHLAEHLVRGGDAPGARRYIDAAIMHLWSGHENDRLIALATRALAMPELLTGPPRLKILVLRSGVFDRLGRREQQRASTDEALAYAHEIGNARGVAVMHSNRGVLRLALGEYEAARADFERYLAYVRETGDLRGEGVTEGNLGSVCGSQGRDENARRHFERGLAIARKLGDPLAEAEAMGRIASTLSRQGRFADSRAQHEQALAIAIEHGARGLEAACAGDVANMCVALGRLEEAHAWYERSLAITSSTGDRWTELTTTGQIGCVHRDLGRFAEAEDWLRRAIAGSAEMGSPLKEGGWRADIALLREMEGELDDAARLLHSAIESQREAGIRGHVAEFLIPMARVERLRGRHAQAVAHLDECLAISEELGRSHFACSAYAERAIMRPESISDALRAQAQLGTRMAALPRLRVQFSVWRATSDAEHLRAAHELLDRLLAGAPESSREQMLEVVPLYRAITTEWRARTLPDSGPESETSAG